MAASMWRMSGPCRRMAAVLLLCALMLSTAVMCEDPEASITTETPTVTNGTTAHENAGVSTSVGGLSGDSGTPSASTAPPGSEVKATSIPISSGAPGASHKTDSPPSSGSSVFVGILVSGLLAALAITLGYLKCQRRTDTKGESLYLQAEESYPVEQDNQGNTLVSLAPLNPPLETPEKPSVNGEAPEADKTEPPPPTNGHSTTKTADTEM
ncbi:uncharacterized protein cd34 [Pungitius pungitius]|uniref:uncharacterized protein cd34 n=1 Tax=Pungitius pungitius TaxID=134920 RepID=UPI002E0EF6F5